MIPPGYLQDLLSRVDVVALIGRHVELRKAGANHLGLCPFHGEKSPSFTVSASKQFYHCFGCGAHGDAIRFLTEYHGMSFVDAVQDLAQQVGLPVPQESRSPEQVADEARQRAQSASLSDVLAQASTHYRQQLKSYRPAIDYLKRRGLDGEIAARFALGYAPEGWHSLASAFASYDDPLLVQAGLVIVQGEEGGEQKRYDRFRDRITFPIRNAKGDVIAFGARVLDKGEPKYLNSPETPIFVKGRELYGLFESRQGLRERGYALVTEGYMDVVALAQLGFTNAVATLGTACTADHVRKLLRFTDHVVFAFDGDAAGRRAAARALEAALAHASDTRSFKFLFLPSEHDPDSYVRSEGVDAFERCVSEATPLSRQLIATAAQDCDLASAEGRSRLLAQAKPLWAALPEGALRLQVLAELAAQASLPVPELSHLWGGASAKAAAPAAPLQTRRPALRTSSRRLPPTPQARALHMLLTHPQWWDQLAQDDHEALHAMPSPLDSLVAWLERSLADHGPRPWAVTRVALLEDADLDSSAHAALPDAAATLDAEWEDLRRALDLVQLDHISQEIDALMPSVGRDLVASERYRALDRRRSELKRRSVPGETAIV